MYYKMFVQLGIQVSPILILQIAIFDKLLLILELNLFDKGRLTIQNLVEFLCDKILI